MLPVCVISGLAPVARQQVELEAVEVAGPEDARVESGLLHEGDDGLADVDGLQGVLVRLPGLQPDRQIGNGESGGPDGQIDWESSTMADSLLKSNQRPLGGPSAVWVRQGK